MPDVAVVMPKMSMTMTEGEVVGWRRQQGEAVRAGEVLLEVMTDKVEMEVEAPADGVLQRVVAGEGDRVPVGEPLAYITAEQDALLGGMFDGAPEPEPASPVGSPAAAPAERPVERPVPPSRKSAVPALPGARRRAGELGVDLASVVATGPDGAVSVRDVEAAHADTSAPPPAAPAPAPTTPAPAASAHPPAPGRTPAATPAAAPAAGGDGGAAQVGFADALDGRRAQIRAAVNAVMERSATVPQFTAWRRLQLDTADRDRGGLSWTTLLLAALARGLRDTESAPAGIRLALAVDTPVGLLAPVVADCDRDDLAGLEADMRDAVDRARRGKLTPSDIDGAVSTVSNLGSWGVERFQALLTPPQASALSVGAVATQPVVRHGAIAVALICEVGLTVDHRVFDGADAARILRAVQSALDRLAESAGVGVGTR